MKEKRGKGEGNEKRKKGNKRRKKGGGEEIVNENGNKREGKG